MKQGMRLLGVVGILTVRKTRDLCLGPAFLVLLFVQQAVLFVIQRSAILSLDRNGLLVGLHPAQFGLLAAVGLAAVFLGIHAAAGLARERESGSLETLFYGPVSAPAYVLAELLSIAAATMVSLLLLLAALLIGRGALGYDLPAALFVLGPFFLLAMLAISAAAVCAALAFRQARTAITVVVSLVLLSMALFAGQFMLSRSGLGGSFFVVFLRTAVAALEAVFRYLFPLGLFFDDLVRYESYGALGGLSVGYYPVYGVAFFLLSIWVMRRRGVAAR